MPGSPSAGRDFEATRRLGASLVREDDHQIWAVRRVPDRASVRSPAGRRRPGGSVIHSRATPPVTSSCVVSDVAALHHDKREVEGGPPNPVVRGLIAPRHGRAGRQDKLDVHISRWRSEPAHAVRELPRHHTEVADVAQPVGRGARSMAAIPSSLACPP